MLNLAANLLPRGCWAALGIWRVEVYSTGSGGSDRLEEAEVGAMLRESRESRRSGDWGFETVLTTSLIDVTMVLNKLRD